MTLNIASSLKKLKHKPFTLEYKKLLHNILIIVSLKLILNLHRELSKSYEASITQLQKDLYESKREVTRVESNMVEALVAKNDEIKALVSSMDAVKSQAAMLEGNLASL